MRMATERPPLPDDADRAQAVRERARNVLVDAGAGTGKTTLVIDRVVDMVAPADPAVAPLPLARLAVITFTRRAAGELRYRLRQKLLAALRDAAEPRAARVPEPVEPDLAAVRALAADVAAQLKGVPGSTSGGRFLRDVAARCREVTATDSPAETFRVLRETLRPREFKRNKRDDFDGQREVWKLYKMLRDTWKGQLVAPLSAWMGARLARLRFVVAKLYEEVKAERAVLDQLDLLVKLRDVLRDRALVRRQLQALFDHVFVDEFQDTDPLQCEVVFFLCEAGAKADEWRRVQLRPGSLTVVGDPKQSIYRFRRADLAMYEEAHRLIRE